jgi:MFS transporter, DHA1 family, inner membrane transport protein
VLALVASLLFVPRKLAQPAPASLLHQLAPLRQPRLLLVYAMTTVGYGGSFIAFTFLAPILQQISGISAGGVSLVLLVYGVSVAVGNVWGGRLADRRGPVGALKLIFLGLAAVLLVLTFTAAYAWAAVLTVLVWGAFAFGNVPGLQLYVVRQAELHTPRAVDVASGLNIAAFNLGIAFGAWGGGLIVEHLGLAHTPWVGGLVVLGAYALTRWAGALDCASDCARDRASDAPDPSRIRGAGDGNSEARHSAFPRHDVDADAIGQIEHRLVSVPIVEQAAGVAIWSNRSIGDAVAEKNDGARRVVLP